MFAEGGMVEIWAQEPPFLGWLRTTHGQDSNFDPDSSLTHQAGGGSTRGAVTFLLRKCT